MNQRQSVRILKEGYHIFYVESKEGGSPESVVSGLQEQINEAERSFEIEFLSNAKIDADNTGRDTYYGFQCVVLKLKGKGK